MIRFLKHTISFLFLLIFILGSIYVWNNYRLNEASRLEGIHSIALGDSHMMCAFSPKKIRNSRNLSQTAEPLFITYRKLQIISSFNPQIDTIFLGISYNSLSDYNDAKLQQEPWASNQLKRVAGYIPLKKLQGIPVNATLYWRYRLKSQWLIPLIAEPSYMGNFKPKKHRLREAELSSVLQKQFYSNRQLREISPVALQYLDSIQKWTEQNEQQLFIVELPVHPKYKERVPKRFKVALQSVRKNHPTNYLVPNEDIYPDSFFHDYSHLSAEGAEHFTAELNLELKRILLE